MAAPTPRADDFAWIDAMTDAQCMEVFWLYVDPPEPFLAQYSPRLLGAAMRRALREIAETYTEDPADGPGSTDGASGS
jgi:hypothetical protein